MAATPSLICGCAIYRHLVDGEWAISTHSSPNLYIRLSTSPGYPRLTTGIPVRKPTGMETRRSESLVITGLHGSECVFWMVQVPATGTCQTMVFFIFYLATSSAVKIMYIHELKIKLTKN
jgi:hypothetical protein